MQQGQSRTARKQIPFSKMTERDLRTEYAKGTHPAHHAIWRRLYGDTDADLRTGRQTN